MQTTVKLYNPGYNRPVTYLMAALFAMGNVILPQLAHLVPQGGMTWLPIYFFTLIAAYKYGWRTGLLTAIASPLVNSIFFGMPAAAVLPAIMLKSVLLAVAAGYAAHRFGRATLALLTAVVLSYQIVGTAGEWIMSVDFYAAAQDFSIGIPGMLLQIIGGWFVINKIKI